jgi:NAD(P)-dependent dehydrogenase (short-subunit alcohol dehydrogenase family)
MPRQETPVWFITGCSTGFGREIAKAVLQRGYRAVVTARDPQKVQDIVEGYSDRVLVLRLDVNDRAQIAECVKNAEATFGHIDVLVNNAGYGYVAAVEEGEDDEIRAMFETNFFSLAAMMRAVLPGMRKRRSGYIVNISSDSGLVGYMAVGYYNSSKFAVEGLSEVLAKEVAPLGIKVLLVEPGCHRTNWAGRSLRVNPNQIADYAETAGANRKFVLGLDGNQAGDPVRAAEAILKAVESPQPPLHLVLGKDALKTIRGKLDLLHHDLDTWEPTTLSADFPDA